MKKLYVSDELIDLYPNTVIAQTLQIYDPGRIGSITTNYTSSIKAPKTRTNERIFEHLSNSKTKSDIPYSSLSCTYEENGFAIIRNARVIVTEAGGDYLLNIYSGPWGYFKDVQTKKLWDIDTLDINSGWSQSDRDGYRNTLTGIVQALVDDGRLVQDQASSAPTIENQGSIVKPPQIYLHTVFEKIFSSFGYTFEGDIFDNAIYKKIVLPLSVIYNDPSFIQAKLFSAAAPGDQVISNPTTYQDVLFNQNVKQGSDGFYDGVSSYIVANPDTTDRYFQVRFDAELYIEVTGGTVDIIIEATGYSSTVESNKGTGNYQLVFFPSLLGLKDGDEVKVRIIKNTGTPIVEVISGQFYTTSYTGTDGEEFFPSIVTDYVYFNKLFDDITILDFLKEMCIRFNLQITQINGIIVVNTLNKILDIRTGPDWTNKRDRGLNRIRYIFSNYGKVNRIKSSKDDFTPDLTEEYGDGTFEIPNENLKEQLTVYTSPFNVTQNINTFGVLMLNMNLEPNFANSGRMPGLRMFFVRDKYDFEPPCLYDAIDRTDYLIGYWSDPNQTNEMGWQFFIDNFHQKYIDRCLRKVRLVEREYNLSDLDIYKFNQQEPIFDNSERFLVTKITNRVSGRSAKVELLKIDSNPEQVFVQGTANNITGGLVDLIEVIGNNLSPELAIQMEYIETVTGNPTWQATFDNGDTDILTVIGNGSSDSGVLDHVGVIDVDADVLKTNNDGDGTDGFPTATGYVEWLRNGVQVNTAVFDSSGHSNTFGLNYTYPDVKAWEVLKVIIHEDGSTP